MVLPVPGFAAQHSSAVSLTLHDGLKGGHALLVVFDRVNTDVVLHTWAQVLKDTGRLLPMDQLLQGVALLSICRDGSYSVGSDICRATPREVMSVLSHCKWAPKAAPAPNTQTPDSQPLPIQGFHLMPVFNRGDLWV